MTKIYLSSRTECSSDAIQLRTQFSIRYGHGAALTEIEVLSRVLPRSEYGKEVRALLGQCQGVVVLIGPGWVDAVSWLGRRWQDDPEDRVRLEIESALQLRIPIVLVLLHGARRPGARDLPTSLLGLVSCQEYTGTRDFQRDAVAIANLLGLPGPPLDPGRPRWVIPTQPSLPDLPAPAVVAEIPADRLTEGTEVLVALVESFGGTVKRDDSRPGRPIVDLDVGLSENADVVLGMLPILGVQPELRKLRLAMTRVTDEQLQHLAGLKELTELDLSSTPITGAGLVHLRGLTNLRKLNLSGTKLDREGVTCVARLASLTELDVSETAIGDGEAWYLSLLEKLEELQLDETGVTDAGVLELTALLPALRWVYVHGTPVTEAGGAAVEGSRSGLGVFGAGMAEDEDEEDEEE